VLKRLKNLKQLLGNGLFPRVGSTAMKIATQIRRARPCLWSLESLTSHHVQPQRSVRTHVLEGELFPLDRGAAGRVILSIDEGTPGAQYDQIRKQGYAITQRERDQESAALACPVFARGSKLLGAISLVIPLYRFTDELVEKLLPQIQRSAAALTHDLGGVSPYSPLDWQAS
jgi:DNA-binding IclR family transcriptional regulator